MQNEQVITFENPELDKVVNESGLQLNEAETIKISYAPYFEQIAEIKEQAKKINFQNPTELDEKIARELRLKTVKIRTGSESVKDERKRIHSLKANVEQSAWNLIKSTCQLDEEMFLQVEKKREFEEKARIEALRLERTLLIESLSENTQIYMLGLMSEDQFQELLSGLKLAKKAKEEAEAKAEAERIEAIRIENARIEAQRVENEKLKAEAEAKEKQLEAERAEARKVEAELMAKLAAEKQASGKLAAEEKAKAEAAIKSESEARAKVEAELKAKQKAEEESKRSAELAAKKAAAAPDKEKLTTWVNSISVTQPEISDAQMKAVSDEINAKFNGFKKWATDLINSQL